MKKLLSWISDNLVSFMGLVLGCSVLASALLSVFTFLQKAWRENQVAMGAYTLSCIAAGFASGVLLNLSKWFIERHEEKRRQRERDKEFEKRCREFIRSVTADEKWFLRKLKAEDHIDVDLSEREIIEQYGDDISGLVTFSEIAPGLYRVRLSEHGRYCMKISDDIINEIQI